MVIWVSYFEICFVFRASYFVFLILLKKSARGIKSFGGVNTIDSKGIAVACAKIADKKKAQNIIILDISKLTSITEYFVICTGINERQLYTIADEIEKDFGKNILTWQWGNVHTKTYKHIINGSVTITKLFNLNIKLNVISTLFTISISHL